MGWPPCSFRKQLLCRLLVQATENESQAPRRRPSGGWLAAGWRPAGGWLAAGQADILQPASGWPPAVGLANPLPAKVRTAASVFAGRWDSGCHARFHRGHALLWKRVQILTTNLRFASPPLPKRRPAAGRPPAGCQPAASRPPASCRPVAARVPGTRFLWPEPIT